MADVGRSYYEALASFQLELKKDVAWNENEFQYFLKEYRPHDKSNDLVMLGFIRHLTLIKDKERDYLRQTLRVPEGTQSNWTIKLQKALELVWRDTEINSVKSAEVIRGNRNRNKMPSVETGVINKIVENLKKAKEVSDAKDAGKIAVDLSEYELVISEYMDALLSSSLDTEIIASEEDMAKVDSLLNESISKSIATHSIEIPFINKTVINKDTIVNDIRKDAAKIIEGWFNEGFVGEIRKELLKTAKSKLKEVEKSVRPNLPKAVEEQLVNLVSEKEVLELGREQARSRYFVSETDVIDYYVSANMLSYYPSYRDFLSALKNHLSAKIILGVDEERYVSLPMKGSDD